MNNDSFVWDVIQKITKDNKKKVFCVFDIWNNLTGLNKEKILFSLKRLCEQDKIYLVGVSHSPYLHQYKIKD